MNQFNKEILDALSSDSKTSLKDVFRNQLEQTVNTLLQEELSAVLGYQPYERNDKFRSWEQRQKRIVSANHRY